jgi:hypothetical protein
MIGTRYLLWLAVAEGAIYLGFLAYFAWQVLRG